MALPLLSLYSLVLPIEGHAYLLNDFYAARLQLCRATLKQHQARVSQQGRCHEKNIVNVFVVMPSKFYIPHMCSQGPLASSNKLYTFVKNVLFSFSFAHFVVFSSSARASTKV
jgi:hypothetical protein